MLIAFGLPLRLFVHNYKQTTKYVQSAGNETKGTPAAPWSRYFARMLDNYVLIFLVALVLAEFILLPDFHSLTPNKQLGNFLDGLG